MSIWDLLTKSREERMAEYAEEPATAKKKKKKKAPPIKVAPIKKGPANLGGAMSTIKARRKYLNDL